MGAEPSGARPPIEGVPPGDLDYHLLVEAIEEYAIITVDPSGTILTWNRGAERIAGYRAPEIVGRPFSCFYPPEDVRAGRPEHDLAEAARSGAVEVEGWRVRKDGERFWADAVLTALRSEDEPLRGFVEVTRDLTSRREVEGSRLRAALEESERRFRATFEQAAVGMAQSDPEGRWLTVNRELCRIVGYSEEELCQMTYEDVTHPDDRDLARNLVRRLHAGEIERFSVEKRWVHREGHVVWVEVTASLVRGPSGAPEYGIVVSKDISDRKRAEEERDRSLVEAREALALRDRFLTIASYELKTPLTALTLVAEAFARPAPAERHAAPHDRLARRTEIVLRQARRLSGLVDQLLDVSWISAGKLPLNLEDVDLAEVAREVVARFAHEAELALAPITFDVAGGPVVGRWNRVRVDHVLTNLVSNAIKFGAGRPVTVAIEGEDERARITVADQGIGIPPEDQASLFRRFGHLGSERQLGGFGLGLWIVRETVVALGGTVRVESAAGRGATFIVGLPLRGPQRASAAP